ncbi:FHA domain-containing protein [Oceanicoccus sp. KOV_DT_Chl]|uniref:FHA domain-containing protein n=1 Tax=Oceanicoccus sp. KOV_DT_Chl TaxID=1904639 RepID=UPI00135CD76D|nr:FHA domain-containing protein [Oceanicoccus sp. KOV_DT_Chl]
MIISGFSNLDETAVREAYALPPSWSLQDNNKIESPAPINNYPDSVIDSLIANSLKDQQSLAAALVVISGKHEGRIIGLQLSSEQQIWNIGRADTGTIQLTDPSISSRHACVFYNNGHWGLTDEDSRNGSKVRSQPITEAALNNNDLIELGQINLIFRML